MTLKKVFLLFFTTVLLANNLLAQKGVLAPKPLFEDPVYNGAADPVIIWNKNEKKWFMFYTNRRANAKGTDGVTWVHGTRIGIAESTDGANWKYRDTANIQYRPVAAYTHWAPDVFEDKGTYHMFLTYVPGIFGDWAHPRDIIHLKSHDLLNWSYVSTLKLASDRVIDATVFQLPDRNWRIWYNNERDSKSIYYADSKDLEHWELKGKAVGDQGGEGPKVFKWKNKYWMLVDNWKGMSFYHSDNLSSWTKQSNRILEFAGKGKDDQAIGGHADVIVSGDRAYIYYFTHPERLTKPFKDSPGTRRSLIQVAELHYNNGEITVNRDQPVFIQLDSKQVNKRK